MDGFIFIFPEHFIQQLLNVVQLLPVSAGSDSEGSMMDSAGLGSKEINKDHDLEGNSMLDREPV